MSVSSHILLFLPMQERAFQNRSFECIKSYKPILRIFYRCASKNAIIQKLIMDVWSIIALILHFLNVLAFKAFYCCQNDRSVVMDSVRISFYQNKSSLLFVRIHVMDENDYQEKDFKRYLSNLCDYCARNVFRWRVKFFCVSLLLIFVTCL